MTSLLILGAGGHAKVVAETAVASGLYTSISFLDDLCADPEACSHVLDWPVLGNLALASHPNTYSQFDDAVVAIGHSSTRLHWIRQLQIVGYRLPTLSHPTAWVSPSAQLGPGSVVFAHAVVQAHSSIGTGVILNSGCELITIPDLQTEFIFAQVRTWLVSSCWRAQLDWSWCFRNPADLLSFRCSGRCWSSCGQRCT